MRKRRSIYLFLVPCLLIVAGLAAFVVTRPAPLTPVEMKLVGSWVTVPSAPFEGVMVFHENRIVDVDMGTEGGGPVRWKIEGGSLMTNEGSMWEDVAPVEVDGNRLVLKTQDPFIFERAPATK